MFSFLWIYDEYVRMVPTPSESEKKLCPIAAATAEGVILLKSGFTR